MPERPPVCQLWIHIKSKKRIPDKILKNFNNFSRTVRSQRTICWVGSAKGIKIGLSALDTGRIGIAAQALGIAQAAFEASVSYAKERQQFNKFLANFQTIQNYLADMVTKIEASRLLLYRAAKVTQIWEGTSEVQKMVIARSIPGCRLYERKKCDPYSQDVCRETS